MAGGGLKDPSLNRVLVGVLVYHFVKLIQFPVCQRRTLRHWGTLEQWHRLVAQGLFPVVKRRQRIKLVIGLDPFVAEMRSIRYLTDRLLHGLHKLHGHIRARGLLLLIHSILIFLGVVRRNLLLGLS